MAVLEKRFSSKKDELNQLYYVLNNRNKKQANTKKHPRDVLIEYWIKKNDLPKEQLTDYSMRIDEILYGK